MTGRMHLIKRITKMMKNLLLITSFAATLISCGDGANKETKESIDDKPVNVATTSMGDLTIAYYEMDSIASSFTFYVNTKKDIDTKRSNLESKIQVQQVNYQKAGEALQKGVQNQTLSQNQIEGYQRKMQSAEQEIYRLQQTEGMQIEAESMQATENLTKKIDSYAATFSKKHGLKIFFSKAIGGQLTYVDPSFDMTTEFIEYINKKEQEIEADIAE